MDEGGIKGLHSELAEWNWSGWKIKKEERMRDGARQDMSSGEVEALRNEFP